MQMILLSHFCLTKYLPFHDGGITCQTVDGKKDLHITSSNYYQPQWDYLTEFKIANKRFKDKQKKIFDDSNRVCNLPDIPDNNDVWITTDGQSTPGMTVRRAEAPPSYIAQIPVGEVHKNRSQRTINPFITTDTKPNANSHGPVLTRSHTVTAINLNN